MTTAFIPMKDFRNNMKRFSEKAKKNGIIYIITRHHEPIFELKPCYNQSISVDETQVLHYEQIEQNLKFWDSEEDDDIFAV